MNLYTTCRPNILLLGDIMIDHNIEGKCNKIANEYPIPVVNISNEYNNLGGCGNVLLNLFALGAKNVYIFSRIGLDDNGKKIRDMLPENTINHILVDSDYITITKNRIYSDSKLICRYDNEIIKYTTAEEEDNIIENIKQIIKNIDSVVFSDYNKGFLTKSLCQRIINLCNELNICTIVDPKNDYSKYINCTVIKPNKIETKQLFNIDLNITGLENGHKILQNLLNCKTSIITLSGDGITAYNNRLYKCSEYTKEIIDVTGAGDIVCSVLGVFYKYLDIELIIKIANHLATISISHIGSYIIKESDLLDTYKYINKTKHIYHFNSEYFPNKKIIFTNGCFDVIHSAHIELFKFCRSLGDIVIVGLNSNDSIKRLKGKTRPIYDLEDRIKILESIEYIDYIVSFEEDTPIDLIKQIRPHILVKGGDYTKDNIIGKEYAEVVIFNYIKEKSTTNTINDLLKEQLIPFKVPVEKIRCGRNYDGGYVMFNYNLNKIEGVYSYGINDDVSFEMDITKYVDSNIYMYDHTINSLPYNHPSFLFIKEKGSLDNIIRHVNTTNNISNKLILKMDIEGCEWEIIEKIDRKFLEKFEQFIIEFHNIQFLQNESFGHFNLTYPSIINVFKKLNEIFYLGHIHGNNHGGISMLPNTIECTYIRKGYT